MKRSIAITTDCTHAVVEKLQSTYQSSLGCSGQRASWYATDAAAVYVHMCVRSYGLVHTRTSIMCQEKGEQRWRRWHSYNVVRIVVEENRRSATNAICMHQYILRSRLFLRP